MIVRNIGLSTQSDNAAQFPLLNLTKSVTAVFVQNVAYSLNFPAKIVMVETNVEAQQRQINKRRMIIPAEIANRFSSKSDFLRYFKEHRKWPPSTLTLAAVQFYVPPDLMVNKDYIRQILTEEKEFLPLKSVKHVNMPMYDELAVKNMWPHCRDIPGIMRHFPDKLPKGRLPDREYFWNVMNTLNEEYVGNLIRHANGERNTATGFKHEEE